MGNLWEVVQDGNTVKLTHLWIHQIHIATCGINPTEKELKSSRIAPLHIGIKESH